MTIIMMPTTMRMIMLIRSCKTKPHDDRHGDYEDEEDDYFGDHAASDYDDDDDDPEGSCGSEGGCTCCNVHTSGYSTSTMPTTVQCVRRTADRDVLVLGFTGVSIWSC